MTIQKLSAFSNETTGGNPAGVLIAETLPTDQDMLSIAAEVGFSETVFASFADLPEKTLRVRYFSPEMEVPFCGHATIALGAALVERFGEGSYALKLNETDISVTGREKNGQIEAILQSPPTNSQPLAEDEISDLLGLFGYQAGQLDPSIPPARIHGGADHFVLALNSREALSQLSYSLAKGKDFMRARGLITIMLVYRKNDQLFHVRNAFASSGVYEDPATGAAAAAFAGYLRDLNWPHKGEIHLHQGDDMGHPSRIHASIPDEIGSSIAISGTVRSVT